jgi:microcin C transport system substrate-binding protein
MRSTLRLRISALVVACATALTAAACGEGGKTTDATAQSGPSTYVYEFPPDIPFDPKEWTTNSNYEPVADPNAKHDMQDRPFTVPWEEFPPTLRYQGPNSNLTVNNTLHGLIYEVLVGVHPETEDFIPGLATHWKIEEDPATGIQTLWFRIDERARWADGTPVTAGDVHATWWHRTQEDRSDAMSLMTFKENFEEPVILDRLTIRVKTKERNWRLFRYFASGMLIYPAKECRIPGAKFLEDYNWKYMVGSGPYHLASPNDVKKGESLTLTRREDWWGWQDPFNKGAFNFKKVRFLVVREPELIWQKFKAGELDWYPVSRASRWADEVPKEPAVQKGWVQARRVFNQAPNGFAGFAFNTRKPPFDDRRVRLAFAHLFNRKKLIEKIMFNQYQEIHSTHPGSDWGAEDEIPNVEFDPDQAAQLLAEAGYTKRDQDGYLIGKDGKRFEIDFEFASPAFERHWLVAKEDFEAGGIKFNLKLVDGNTLIKKVTDREFTLHFQSWGGLVIPNPETSWRSDLADKPANNNITGFKNKRVDELCEEYNRVSDRKRQKEIVREIDKLVCAEIPYAFGWYAGYLRVLYWNRFGQPAKYFSRISDDSSEAMIAFWWWDAEKDAALTKAMKDGVPFPDAPTAPVDVKPWEGRKPGK